MQSTGVFSCGITFARALALPQKGRHFMKPFSVILTIFIALVPLTAAAQSQTICTLAIDARQDKTLLTKGDCDRRISPASTFKIALSLMGFDTGILTSPTAPEWPFQVGYLDARPEWRVDTAPDYWMAESVIWYSRQITARLGMTRFRTYVDAMEYGNRDLSGTAALDRAWLSDTLQISPAEQVRFLHRMLIGDLAVHPSAVTNTETIMRYVTTSAGWQIYGKTGAGWPRRADGQLSRDTPFGWYVGWATRDDQTIIFARLIIDSKRQSTAPGFRARDALISELFSEGGWFD